MFNHMQRTSLFWHFWYSRTIWKNVAENNHNFSKTVTVINKVEHTFITKWNYCHQFTKPAWQSHVQQFQKNWTVLYMKISLVKVRFFRSTSHFNKEQKKTIVAVFYGWWTDWGKETPDKVHKLLRNKLQHKDYMDIMHKRI